jgi:hypothetical protein
MVTHLFSFSRSATRSRSPMSTSLKRRFWGRHESLRKKRATPLKCGHLHGDPDDGGKDDESDVIGDDDVDD